MRIVPSNLRPNLHNPAIELNKKLHLITAQIERRKKRHANYLFRKNMIKFD